MEKQKVICGMQAKVRWRIRNVIFITVLTLLTVCLFVTTGYCQTNREIEVRVDPRIELMSTIFRLAGAKEYNNKQLPNYVQDVEDYFSKYKDHKAVKMAKKLRRSSGISYNAPMGLAVYLRDVNTLTPRVSLRPVPEDLDDRWTPENIPPFLESVRKFAIDTKFMTFFRNHRGLYNLAVNRMRNTLAQEDVKPWFEKFFGSGAKGEFTLILGMQNGGPCYAAGVTLEEGTSEIYSVLGVWLVDDDGQPRFDQSVVSTIVHEFCHSYTNPIVDKWADQLRQSGKTIFPHVKKQMSRQAYPNWRIMMYESFVRACVIRYVDEKMGAESADRHIMKDTKRGFLWIEELADLLKEYESERNQFATFEDFCPRIVDFFNDYAGSVGDKVRDLKEKEKQAIAQMKADSPKIISMVPENGAKKVDPNTSEIRIVFDRPMQPDSYSVMMGDKAKFPKLNGEVHYDSSHTVFIIPVSLKPDWDYNFGLNSKNTIGFRDKSGNALYPVVIKFKTGK